MKAVTIIQGQAWEELAALTLPAFTRHTGLTPEIIRPEATADPYLLKLQILKLHPDQRVLFFDVDLIWLSEPRDSLEDEGVFLIAQAQRMRGVNSGVWVADQHHAAMFERAEQLYREGLRTRGDEGALMAAMKELQPEYRWLLPEMNWQALDDKKKGFPVIALHPMMTRDVARKFEIAQRYLDV